MKKKKGNGAFFVFLLFCIVISLFAGLIYTKAGRRLTSKVAAGYLHNNINYVPSGNNHNTTNRNPSVSEQSGTEEMVHQEDDVINILLLGEEAIRSTEGKGRTDVIMIASIHAKEKVIRLTSLLRDTYVEVPGYAPCKLNAVYAKGGVSLLYEVIQSHYKIKLDGYVLVGFEDFEKIIDVLGGVEVTLTEEEAEYLRTHNYISKEEYRNVSAGTQIMNGNQTLGYCRIRFVANINGTQYDYGRTERHRMVLSEIFENYKNAGITKWIQILQNVLGMLTTDIDQKLLEDMLFAVYDNRIMKIEHFRVPVEGAYTTPGQVGNITSPIVPDWEATVAALREFIYGGTD